jgi:hypothetical protein
MTVGSEHIRVVTLTLLVVLLAAVFCSCTRLHDGPADSNANDDDSAAALISESNLARILAEVPRRSAGPLHGRLTSDDWPAAGRGAQKRDDVDYGWGGGRFGKRRTGDALGIAGRFGRSVEKQQRTDEDGPAAAVAGRPNKM